MTMDGDIEMLQALHGDAFILHCRKDPHILKEIRKL